MRSCPIAVVVLFASINSALADDQPSDVKADDAVHAVRMTQSRELFKKEVRSILTGRCSKCHGGESTEGDFDLTTREGLLKGGADGKAVVPGNAKASRLYKLVTHAEEPNMPEDGAKLSDNAIAALARWIDLGAAYDKPLLEMEEDPLAWTTRKIDAGARSFWSFQPLSVVAPPKFENDLWSRTDVDRFLLQKLHEAGLEPNPLAERRKLIRRAYFDLIGLPPTAEEVEAFVRDEDSLAFDNLLDRLLQSPHYGERWGRHWLDVARFGESHGFEQDYDRPHAYHYRDFVIRALNQDMPYDQFVRWQIAGDEIAPDNPLAMMATGFLGAGVFPTQLTEKEFEPARYDELADMVGTMGTAMLGVTIGCARCHDHKFDPVPQSDFYRLASTFTTTIRSEIELDLDPQGTQAVLAKWEQEHAPLVAALAEYEREQLPAQFDKWLKQRSTEKAPSATWVVLDLAEYKSHGGATLTKQDDGSVLASGVNPDFDQYTFVAMTHLEDITAIRLEALAHSSFVKGGPGRAGNGNMGLGNFTVTAEPLDGEGSPVALKLVDPLATFQQNDGNLSIAASIDGDKKTGWAVDPQFGKDHAAVFHTVERIGFAGGTRLTFTFEFNVNNKHNIGRPRLSISTAQPPVPLGETATPQAIVELLRLVETTAGQLSDEQRQTLMKWYRPLDEQWRKLDQQVRAHVATKPAPQRTKVMVTSEGLPPMSHHADGRGFPHFYKETYFLARGDNAQKLEVAPPGFLQVLTDPQRDESAWQLSPPEGSRSSYRRRSLANWMTDTEYGAGHLLARVIVNRLWQHHLGRGIVATTNDFGYQGQRPTHPELLDWLAAKLIEGGWRLKPIHKLIMSSAVYTQDSTFDADDALADPDNRWCWRFAPRRLEAEVIRDAMLAASGQLDRTMFGPGTLDEGMKRRSIYFMIKRSKLIPMMQIFDSPEPLVSVGDRPSTTIAPQALLFMNNANVRGYARAFAQKILPSAESSLAAVVQQGYLEAVGRPPNAQEVADNVDFLEQQLKSYSADKTANAKELAVADFCQVLMCLNEFIFIE